MHAPSPATPTAFRPARRGAALARARARKESAGAAMFIVAITLGLLAAMGVYGLSATAMDVRAAGHLRETAQARSAGEHAMLLTAETFTPGTSAALVRAMQGGQTGAAIDIQTTRCKTSIAYNPAILPPSVTDIDEYRAKYRSAVACLSLSSDEMKIIAERVNQWLTYDPMYHTFTARSFGDVQERPFFRVEVTNPVDIPAPPGSDLGMVFTQVTTTVFVDMKQNVNDPATSIAVGRGRMTVGPYRK